ncbi:hypothetical protein Q3G72_034911 [Acer saccharum]|nr:hypothetical protein Q3G72_034911 [Acer saccharum]
MLSCWRLTPTLCLSTRHRSVCYCRATASVQSPANGDQNNNGEEKKKKIVIVGSGWAGLGAAHHLCKQGFDVKVVDDGNGFGSPDDVCIQGFWYSYRNIFSLVDELGIEPFTNWMKSVLYSKEGLEVEFPIFQDLPQLPTPLGTLFYTQFNRVPLIDRLTSLALMAAVIDFNNTDVAWKKYDSMLPATLGILYYFILAQQKNFDLVWCWGTLKEKIFDPWMDSMRTRGCEFLDSRKVTDFVLNEETGCISEVVCGKEKYNADAVILAVGISTLQELVKNSAALCTQEEEFLKVSNLSFIDVISVKLRFDKKVNIPNASNACSGFGDSFAWTFFDLNQIYDEHKDDPVTVLQADFYHANELLPAYH